MDRQYRSTTRDGSLVADFAYRARTGEVNAHLLAYAGYGPAQDFLGWPPSQNPWVKRAYNGAILPGVVPLEVWLDNLKQLGYTEDTSNVLMQFDKAVAATQALYEPSERDVFTELEENYKLRVCEQILEKFSVKEVE